MTTELLTIEHFSDKVGQIFTIEEGGMPPFDLTLTEARAARAFAGAPRVGFSLTFTARGDALPQRMYPLRHVTLGLHAIFLVPVAQAGDVVTYQAVFN